MDTDKKNIAKLLCDLGFSCSMSMSRRFVFQGAVQVNGKEINDVSQEVEVAKGDVVKCGKKEKIIG